MLDNAHRPITADEFLEMDLGTDLRCELEDGVIKAMVGGTAAHSRVQRRLMVWLGNALRGSGCAPFGTDLAVRITDTIVRYPDVTVHCGEPDAPANDQARDLGDPRIIFEVLSPSTAAKDRKVKLGEYQGLEGVDTIVLVDPEDETIQVHQRLSATTWRDDLLGRKQDVELPSLNLTIPHAEIFARD